MDNIWLVATVWMALALAASLVSIRIGLSVALSEIILGVFGGNVFHLQTTVWIDFLASFGAILLTFLAGAEIDPVSFRKNLKSSLLIGGVSFLLPFIGAWLFALWVLGWDMRAAQIAGTALSTTSVAVVYAVMIETGLNETKLGKLILAACFVTDLGTVLALGVMFAHFDIWMAMFIGITALSLFLLPKMAPNVVSGLSKRVSEPQIKFFLLILFGLAWLATAAGSEAVLPAYLIGLVTAGTFVRNRDLLHRIRALAFATLTPFYFIKAGLYVSIPAVVAGSGVILLLLLVKVGAKFLGVWPLSRVFKLNHHEGLYTTLLMSTGLTFGSIAALFGLNNGLIDQRQYTILVTVVIASAIVPTLIAQKWFSPRVLQGTSEHTSSDTLNTNQDT